MITVLHSQSHSFNNAKYVDPKTPDSRPDAATMKSHPFLVGCTFYRETRDKKEIDICETRILHTLAQHDECVFSYYKLPEQLKNLVGDVTQHPELITKAQKALESIDKVRKLFDESFKPRLDPDTLTNLQNFRLLDMAKLDERFRQLDERFKGVYKKQKEDLDTLHKNIQEPLAQVHSRSSPLASISSAAITGLKAAASYLSGVKPAVSEESRLKIAGAAMQNSPTFGAAPSSAARSGSPVSDSKESELP